MNSVPLILLLDSVSRASYTTRWQIFLDEVVHGSQNCTEISRSVHFEGPTHNRAAERLIINWLAGVA